MVLSKPRGRNLVGGRAVPEPAVMCAYVANVVQMALLQSSGGRVKMG